MPIEGETITARINADLPGFMNKDGFGVCSSYMQKILGTNKNEVNHCPAAQQWAGLYSVNSANLCLRGIFGIACIIFQFLLKVKEVT